MKLQTPADFHVLTERYRLTGTIVTTTGLRVGGGTGIDAEASDLPVLRDDRGFPFIPGGSLKGVIRSTIEGLLHAVEPRHPVLWACDPLEESDRSCGYHASNNRADAVSRIPESCAACRLFGSRVLASHVRISDAMFIDQRSDRSPIERRDGVAIDRDLAVAFHRRKYDFEVIAPGSRFGLELFVENPEHWSMGLLLLGLEQLWQGFTALGGFGSRGLGRVNLEQESLTITCTRASDLFEGREPTDLNSKLAFAEWREELAATYRGGR